MRCVGRRTGDELGEVAGEAERHEAAGLLARDVDALRVDLRRRGAGEARRARGEVKARLVARLSAKAFLAALRLPSHRAAQAGAAFAGAGARALNWLWTARRTSRRYWESSTVELAAWQQVGLAFQARQSDGWEKSVAPTQVEQRPLLRVASGMTSAKPICGSWGGRKKGRLERRGHERKSGFRRPQGER